MIRALRCGRRKAKDGMGIVNAGGPSRDSWSRVTQQAAAGPRGQPVVHVEVGYDAMSGKKKSKLVTTVTYIGVRSLQL